MSPSTAVSSKGASPMGSGSTKVCSARSRCIRNSDLPKGRVVQVMHHRTGHRQVFVGFSGCV